MGSEVGQQIYEVRVELAWMTYDWEQFRKLVPAWDRQFGCQIQEQRNAVTLTIGRPREAQLLLRGRRTRKKVRFYSGRLLDGTLNENMLASLFERIVSVQTKATDILGLVVKKDGHHCRPLAIRNGELIDQARMMDILWAHFSATRVRESRRLEEVYHFIRDVGGSLAFGVGLTGTVGNLLFLDALF